MNRGEVWWVDFDPSVGSEIRKTRPAVIVSNNTSNRNITRLVVVPLTSNTEHLYPSEALVTAGGKTSKAMANQIATVDKSRIRNRFCTLSRADMRAVEKIIKAHLALA